MRPRYGTGITRSCNGKFGLIKLGRHSRADLGVDAGIRSIRSTRSSRGADCRAVGASGVLIRLQVLEPAWRARRGAPEPYVTTTDRRGGVSRSRDGRCHALQRRHERKAEMYPVVAPPVRAIARGCGFAGAGESSATRQSRGRYRFRAPAFGPMRCVAFGFFLLLARHLGEGRVEAEFRTSSAFGRLVGRRLGCRGELIRPYSPYRSAPSRARSIHRRDSHSGPDAAKQAVVVAAFEVLVDRLQG
jgi:hypothetical protein